MSFDIQALTDAGWTEGIVSALGAHPCFRINC